MVNVSVPSVTFTLESNEKSITIALPEIALILQSNVRLTFYRKGDPDPVFLVTMDSEDEAQATHIRIRNDMAFPACKEYSLMCKYIYFFKPYVVSLGLEQAGT